MKHLKMFLGLVLSVSVLNGCAKPENKQSSASVEPVEIPAEVTITDHADRTVTVKTNPEHVVVTDILPLPSTLAVYLGSADSIAAMQPASMNPIKNGILSEIYPNILNAKTDIMNGEDLNIEAIAALNPDVVYYNANNKAEQEMLENAGLTAVGFSATGFGFDAIKTYQEWMKLLNAIYPNQDTKRLDTILHYSETIYDDIQKKVASVEDKQKILFLFQYDENAMITSSSKFFGEWWSNAVGGVNVATNVEAKTTNAKITMEQVYEWNPDVIFITNFTPTKPDDLYNNAIGDDDWSQVQAVKDHRVYKMPLGAYRTYTPGIDTPDTLLWMAQAVYPELFKDEDIKESVKVYYFDVFGIELSDEQIAKMYTPNAAASEMK